MSMFLGALQKTKSPNSVGGNRKRSSPDTTTIGDLVVPNVGIGTISWSSSSCK